MKNKSFFIFFFSFLTVISILVIPSLVLEKDYKKMLIFTLILAFLIIISISLYVFFSKSALDFSISNDIITFRYDSKSSEIQITDIKNIVITQYRYTFILKNGKKIFVSRLERPFKLQTKIDNRVIELSRTYGISIDGVL